MSAVNPIDLEALEGSRGRGNELKGRSNPKTEGRSDKSVSKSKEGVE